MKKLVKTTLHLIPKNNFSILLLILFTYSSSVIAQISGKVLEANGDPLIGVNVTIKDNSTAGTITDFDGNYTINAENGETLVFSYIGYESKEIIVDGNSINVNLAEAGALLDEVVVVGYGAVDKKDLTGVVTKVTEKDFVQGSFSSPEKLLNGKVAGLQVSSSGEPGSGSRLRIRGGTSLDASSDPLIVVDGIPLDNRGISSARNPLNFINASDVASMTILKDASAAAIYGSRGANGVIIITTKSGTKGKPKFNYNGNSNVSIFSGSTTNLSPNNFRAAISAKAPQEIEFLGEASTDWVEEVTQNARSQEHNVSVSGATDKLNYYISGGFLRRNGVLKTSAHETKSASANLSTKVLNEKLTISLKSKVGFSDDTFAPNVIGAALAFDPTRPVLDPDSEFGGFFQWNDPLATNNPVSSLLLTDHRGQSTRLLNNLNLNYQLPFLDGLSITSNLSYDRTTGDKRNLQDPLLKDGENFVRGGSLFNETLRNYSALIETYGTYKTRIESINSGLEFTLGHSWQDFDQENRWETGRRLTTDSGPENYMFTEDIVQDSFLVHNRLISFFGRANLTLSDKYLLTASLRRDGSSRFGDSNKWGLFPSAAFGWRILEEDFAKGLNNTFTNLKLRLSWGVTGNEDINDFLFKTFYSFGTDDARVQFGDEFVNTLRGTGVDPDIKWEETSSLNLGIDFGFWNNRINGSVDVYQKNTDDLLFTVAVPGFTNLKDRILTNIGEMENKGIELALNAVVIDRNDWDLNFGFNMAHNNNRITKLDNSNDPSFAGYEAGGISGDVGQTIQILRVGESIETFRTYTHILDANGKPVTDTEDRNEDGFLSLLDMYVDVNEDGLINENDLTVNQKAAPDFIFGLTSNLRFKNLDLSALLRAHTGNYVYNNVASSTGYFQRLTDRKTNNIDESAFIVNFNERQLKSDYYIEDASFIKLDNVTLGYNISDKLIFRDLRIYATVTNLLTFTNYSGLDPELPQFSGGIDNNLYPISRNFLIGLNANF